MPTMLVRFPDGVYCEWSTIVDAPVSWALTREEAVAEHGKERVLRTEERNCSMLDGEWWDAYGDVTATPEKWLEYLVETYNLNRPSAEHVTPDEMMARLREERDL
jgi:hypothetical protein